ncbi:thermonuclease family protein [Rhizobium oryzicola]|uniref:Thermonuclease family protein n=1 Tax=Rhizobium oryzicola TaxID=1232668 RepID=A0ABT8T1L0_9HYPH|nr:thermonuclease family protein [Rhizobium oryzicola]MDO1584649.1 thermonuclease family protein [Rhizobium oryzicola]
MRFGPYRNRHSKRLPQGRDVLLTLFFVGLVAAGASIVDHVNAPDPLIGPFRVVDGDTLAHGRERLRLVEIDAPELEQTCQDGDGREWRCGEAAREALRKFARQDGVQCQGRRRDRYQRLLVTCTVGAVSVNEVMVSSGMALASGGAYVAEESEARRARLGIWQGTFETPREWRRRMAQEREDDAAWPGLDHLWKRIW